jgi:CheY-like chemotaxis protein
MSGARILIVEDRQLDLEPLQRALAGAGHDLIVARDGAEGIEAARREHPELVVCDIGLPRVGGLEVIHTLRSDVSFDRMPIVAVTGHAQPGERDTILAAGANAMFAKPVNAKELLAEIERLLSSR